MITKRWAARIGLFSASAVLLTSIGVLISHGGDATTGGEANQGSNNNTSHIQNLPISLSAASSDSPAVHH